MKRISILVAAGAVAAGVFFSISPFAGARPARQATTTIRVTATEYKFKLSQRRARHGLVVFKVVNKGVLKHDFKIAGKKTPKIGAGKSATLKVTLKKGSYKYICTIDAHATLGMKGTFKVT